MSWLARSIATSLRIDGEDDHPENDVASITPNNSSPVKGNEEEKRRENGINNEVQLKELELEDEEEERRGVKEDLTELKQTLTRQLWGVASFLAPPPDHSVSNLDQSQPSDRSASYCDEREPSDSGIGHDFAEIGGRLRNMSKMASNYFPFGSEENGRENFRGENLEELETGEFGGEDGDDDDWELEGAVGITDEVLAFARNIARHPETWLDFPLDEEEDLDDFDLSDTQREHVLAIERFAPRLAALRIELCPCHMTESYFWKVYFVLLHSRLHKHDAEILSTPQVMEARATWIQELHKQTKPESGWFGSARVKDDDNVLHEDFECARTFDFSQATITTTDYETVKHPIDVLLVGSSLKTVVPNYEEDEDDWLNEEDSDLGGYKTIIPVGNEEDFSFSDLEDDASNSIPINSKRVSEDETVKSSGMNTRAEDMDNSLHGCEPYSGRGVEGFYDASCLGSSFCT
ncbi:BSD DOMAIN-CONTAINING PROTEIN [Salix koriyanagi]|uniref:BSD DOMAIN-CONTAINING PROTEIN n=1 Tax=Salix koriyanagi TaxID=2511006 RepID=A0A9Q0U2G7_9ROSI|nr:BSD DOMAIN-CONTAINING PROTEIN [Salix koriyanagi]